MLSIGLLSMACSVGFLIQPRTIRPRGGWHPSWIRKITYAFPTGTSDGWISQLMSLFPDDLSGWQKQNKTKKHKQHRSCTLDCKIKKSRLGDGDNNDNLKGRNVCLWAKKKVEIEKTRTYIIDTSLYKFALFFPYSISTNQKQEKTKINSKTGRITPKLLTRNSVYQVILTLF